MNRYSFLSHGADRSRLPVAVLSGFLSSGKTTLVNALLRDPWMAGTAVAVNEFGEIPLDRDLIDHGADKTVEWRTAACAAIWPAMGKMRSCVFLAAGRVASCPVFSG